MNRVRSRYYGQLERERERHMAKKFNFLSASKSFCDCAKIKLSHPIYHVTLLLNHIFWHYSLFDLWSGGLFVLRESIRQLSHKIQIFFKIKLGCLLMRVRSNFKGSFNSGD